MSSNQDLIHEKYKDAAKEENRNESSRAAGLEFHYTKKFLEPLVTADSNVLEVGCATGYYAMHFADRCKSYTGIDITPENIEILNEKINARGLTNVSARVGDATDLKDVPNEAYDVVLALGPMYHLPYDERGKVFDECARVCKKGGTMVFAFISTLGVYVFGSILWPDKYPNETASDFLLRQGTDDLRPGLFFFSTPEEMSSQAKAHGLCVERNVGVNFAFCENIINDMSEEQFKVWMELNDRMTESESCAGLSTHTLCITKHTDHA